MGAISKSFGKGVEWVEGIPLAAQKHIAGAHEHYIDFQHEQTQVGSEDLLWVLPNTRKFSLNTGPEKAMG